jgi:hypothetical protein
MLVLLFTALSGAATVPALSSREIEALSHLEQGSAEEAHAAARARLEGQGARIAWHYLRHTGTPPGALAYLRAFEALGDAESASVLIDGLVEPPEPESGPQFTAGGRQQHLPRYEGEIAGAIEAVLAREAVRRDPRVAQALEQAIATLRARPHGRGRGPAARAVELLGKCDSDAARETLRRLATDPDAETRTAALAALGASGAPADAGLLARVLLSDPQPEARGRAAAAIAQTQAREAIPALRTALQSERHPEVVDAVVPALASLAALPDDPALCLDAAGRGWDGFAVSPAFACWRARASDATLTEAAVTGPPIVRTLAMAALFERPSARDQPLVRFTPRLAPPPPPGPARAATIVAVPPRTPPPEAPARFDEETRRRLLASAVEVLSHPARALPDRPNAISHAVAARLNGLLLAIAGGDMRLALDHADRIATSGGRTPNDGRLAASQALWRADARAYEAMRRPRQTRLAAAIALLAAALAVFPALRVAAVAAAVPPAAWAIWTLAASGVRELPPLGLAPLTVVGSASLAAAFVAALATAWRERSGRHAWPAGLLFGTGATIVAGMAAFFVCGAARWFAVYPVGGEGWELIFEPLAATIVAVMLCALAYGAAALAGRWMRPQAAVQN